MGLERKLTGQPVLGSLLTFAILFGVLFYRENLFYLPTTIWVITGEKRQFLWNWFLDNVTQDQFTIWVSGTLLILILQYWIIGALYSWMDLTLKPRALRKYKIQPATNEPLEKKKLIQVVKQVLFNQTVVGIPAIYLGGRLFMWRDPPPVRELPEFHWVFLQFLFFLLEQEICYYYVHRLLHYKYLYRFIHKKHHEWTSPIAISAIYCHPVEQFVANLLPVFFGCFILNAHVTTYLTWFSIAIIFTLSEHCGYHLPFMTSPEFHDFHHYSYNNNFGFLGLMDGFHATNLRYTKSKSSKRHFVLKGFKSARELVPDERD